MRAKIIAAAMQKGGVGKTTTVCNLARAAAQRGHQVLVVDLDPQGNTTDALAADELPPDVVSIADAVLPNATVPLDEVLVPTVWERVTLAPVTSNGSLARADQMIASERMGGERCLQLALEPVVDRFDLVLIDNAPALGTLLVNALTASHQVLVVMEAHRWAETGLAQLGVTVDKARRFYNPDLTYAGIVISKWRNTLDERNRLAEVVQLFPQAPVFPDRIPLWADISRTLNQGFGLDDTRNPTRLRVLAEAYGRIVDAMMADRSVAA